MPYSNFGDNLHKIGNKIIEYGEYKLDYYKLLLYKTVMKMARSIFFALLFGAVLLLIFFFISFGVAHLIGDALGNIAYGYLIMGGFYILILILTMAFGRKILERRILYKTSEWFINDDYKKDRK
ncbi:MAG TPA: hypothetical protein VK050_05470 [Flavobacteriaceae bacterium]|nr:hypothetical protein [Flavobacteriaceae bacterium]